LRTFWAIAGLKGSKSKTLEDWLRDEYFEQHAKLFHDRPLIWHFWDGRPDGFHALINYHKLDHATLQKLTYSYLGNWIQQQSDDAKADKPGAAERLGAARALQTELAKILEGEADPKTNTGYDIFVRLKPIKTKPKAGIQTSTTASAKTSAPSCWQVTSVNEELACSAPSLSHSKTKTAAPNPPAPNPTIPGSGAPRLPAPIPPAGKTSSATAGMTST
jgi:hypothetical protein